MHSGYILNTKRGQIPKNVHCAREKGESFALIPGAYMVKQGGERDGS